MARRERFGEGVVIRYHDRALSFNGDPPCGKTPLNREADGGGAEVQAARGFSALGCFLIEPELHRSDQIRAVVEGDGQIMLAALAEEQERRHQYRRADSPPGYARVE